MKFLLILGLVIAIGNASPINKEKTISKKQLPLTYPLNPASPYYNNPLDPSSPYYNPLVDPTSPFYNAGAPIHNPANPYINQFDPASPYFNMANTANTYNIFDPSSPYYNPLSPSPYYNPLDPSSPYYNPLDPSSPYYNPLDPSSPYYNPLDPSSPYYNPLSRSPYYNPLETLSPNYNQGIVPHQHPGAIPHQHPGSMQPHVHPSVGNQVVRLVGGTPSEGRVEVNMMNVWRSVCADSWDNADATVVCRQLGYPLGGEAVHSAYVYYGYGNPQVWLDEVQCAGHEPSIVNCPHPAYGIHNCDGRTHVAGARCNTQGIASPVLPPFVQVGPSPVLPPNIPVGPVLPPSAVVVRLSGGRDRSEGKVEVNVMGQWRSVCADHFEHPDADVVCRMIGFPHGDMISDAAIRFGPGIPQVWMDDVSCTGHESNIAQCPHRGFGVANCNGATQVAGVSCSFDVPATGPHVQASPPQYMPPDYHVTK